MIYLNNARKLPGAIIFAPTLQTIPPFVSLDFLVVASGDAVFTCSWDEIS